MTTTQLRVTDRLTVEAHDDKVWLFVSMPAIVKFSAADLRDLATLLEDVERT